MNARFDAAIILAHGAPDARWGEPFVKMRAELSARLDGVPVALAFMEFAKPTFADAVAEVRAAGGRSLLVVPVFLSGGGHVMKDVPRLVAPEKERFPELEFAVSGAIGEEPEVRRGMMDAVVRLVRG